MSYVAQYEVGRCNIGSITGSSGIRGYSEWWCGFCDGGDPAVEDGINDATDEKDGKFIEYGVDATTYEEVCEYFEENFDLESVVDCYEFGNTSSIRITENWTEKPHEGYSYLYTCCSFMDVVDLLYNQISWLYFPGGYYGIRSIYETGFGPGYPTSYWTKRIGWFEEMYQLVANKRGVDVATLLSAIKLTDYDYNSSPRKPGVLASETNNSETPEEATNTYKNINVYDSDGRVNDEKIAELQLALENDFGLVRGSSDGNNIGGQYNKESCEAVKGTYLGFKYWDGNLPRGQIEGIIYQCPWWAIGRACEHLGNTSVMSINGNGGQIYENANEKYNRGLTPKANSLAVYSGTTYGHVAYVEAVDNVEGFYYISHAGSGNSWYGIQKVAIGSSPFSNLSTVGFVYIEEPIN